jgi:hypothetical protein
MTSAASGMMASMSDTISNSNDLALVESGAPAYLLMIDTLICQDPENETLLSTAALLYTAYSDVFVKDTDRSRKMADKAVAYAQKAVCLASADACGLRALPFDVFEKRVSKMRKRQVPALFALGSAWTGWIMANQTDLNAIADLAYIELIMQGIIELSETYRNGDPYLYLGTLSSFLPPALGGRPEQGKRYFEKAIDLSRGKNLMIKVMYAKFYARMIFDRALHDQLLSEVLASDPTVPGYTLVNTWARKQASEMLESADDYF